MNTKEAIVLAGGLGTRLKDILPDIPKCMAPVNGKPFLSYVLSYLEMQGIEKVILSVGYLKDHIISYFGNKYKTLSIEYSIENEPLGTGGAIKLALEQCQFGNVFVLNGDTSFSVNLPEMEGLHFQSKSEITIAVKHVIHSARYGVVDIDKQERVISFIEKDSKSESNWINGGVYLIRKQIFNDITKRKFSFENDFLKILHSSLKIYAFKSTDFFLDIGVPEDYYLAQTHFFNLNNHVG